MNEEERGVVTKLVQRVLLAGARRRTGPEFDLSRVRSVPRSLRLPLLRTGLDPDPRLGQTRRAEPLSQLARYFGRTIWLASGHPEVRKLLADTTSFSNDIRQLIGSDQSLPQNSIGGLGFTDPPEHTRLRQILTPEFTAARLERLRPRIQEIVDAQLDVLAAHGPAADLVEHFARPVPFQVITELLGLTPDDTEAFWRIGAARFDVSAGGVGAFRAASESRELLLTATRRERANPGDGLIGSIIKTLGDDVDDVTLSGLADGVLLGGYETTASTIALGTVVLLESPEGRAVMIDPAARAGTVEELLRYLSVVQVAFPRFARQDMEVLGQSIKAGDVVIMSLSGANRDERLGDQMDQFDPHRKAVSHNAFGHGFHRCVGAELARMELNAAFPALLSRFPDLHLRTPVDRLTFRKLSFVYSVDELPVVLTA